MLTYKFILVIRYILILLQELVAHGAKFLGFVHTMEIAFELTGQNMWYGTPRNYLDPCTVPGGSSSGSGVNTLGYLYFIYTFYIYLS